MDMKRFLISLSLFILIIALLASGLSALSDYAINQRKDKVLTISKDITRVFMGDSNIECAINDSLITNSINVAQSGEAYLYTYIKLKSLLECNNQIQTIFLGFSYVDLLKDTEEKWLFNEGFVIERTAAYSYLMNYPEKYLIVKNNPKAYFRGLMKSIISNSRTFINSFSSEDGRIQNFGGYEYLVRDKLQEEIKINQLVNEKPHEKALIQEKYLIMISQLCQQKSIKLVLLNTPKHKSYFSNDRISAEQIWLSVRNSLSGDSLLDLSTLAYPDSYYGDIIHLNYIGAKVFSGYLNERLNTHQDDSSIE